MGEGKERFNRFMKRLAEKAKDMMHDALDWFQEEVQPDLLDFMDDNKEVAAKIVKRVALEAITGGEKRVKAGVILKEELEANEGIILDDDNAWWIDTLVQFVFAVLRSKKEV